MVHIFANDSSGPKSLRDLRSLRSKRCRRSRNIFFWGRCENWDERNTDGRSGEGEGEGRRFLSSLPLPFLALFCARPNFRPFKRRKMLQTCEKPYTTETLATQARTYKKYVFEFPFNSFLTFHLTADHTCYNNTGETYAGRVNVSKSGRHCRPWPTMDPPGSQLLQKPGWPG